MRVVSCCALVWAWSVCVVQSAAAQEPQASSSSATDVGSAAEPTIREDSPRIVGAHRFVPFQIVAWPLVTKRISSVTSIGPFRSAQDGNDLTLLKLLEGLVFEWAVLPWLALSAQMAGAAAQGVHLEGIFKAGESYAYGGSVSALARLVERSSYSLSARLLGGLLDFDSVVPERLLATLQFVDGEIDVQRPAIDEGGMIYRAKAVLGCALGIRPWLGLQADLAFDLDTVALDEGGTEVKTTLDLGAGLSFDLKGTGLPLTLLAGGRLLQDLNGEKPFNPALQTRGETRGEFELGGYYSGRADVDIGFTVTAAVGGGDYSLLGNGIINYYW